MARETGKQSGSVRMGPISLVSLIIVLCLAVMTVLSVSTAHALYSSTSRQASSTTDAYLCEQAGQAFLANVDEILVGIRNGGDSIVYSESTDGLEVAANEGESSESIALSEQSVTSSDLRSAALEALRSAGDSLVSEIDVDSIYSAVEVAETDNALPSLSATFVTDSDRRLTVKLAIKDDGTYRILSWKTTTFWNNYVTEDTLWSGETTD